MEEMCADDDKDQLIDLVKSENYSVDGEIPSGFGINVENDADDENIEDSKEWAEMKIEPYELTCADVIPMSSKCVESSEPSDPLANEELEPKPPKRMKHGEEKLERYGEDLGLTHLINQLIDIYPMSERDATGLLEKFLDNLHGRFPSEPGHVRLQMYELRLEVAKLAFIMGIPGFMPDDQWFINFMNLFPGRFAHKQEVTAVPGSDSDELVGQLAEWYHKESSKHMVSPGQLEREIYSIAEKLGKNPWYLSKDEVRLFVEKQGLYRNINGKVSRIVKVGGGLSKHLFEVEFEAWYHDWPVFSDELLLKIMNLEMKHWAMFKSYLAILYEWLIQVVSIDSSVSPGLSIAAIQNTERTIGLAVFDSGKSYFDIYKAFSDGLPKEIHKIRSFNNLFGERYCYRSYTLCSEHLKKNAEELALIMGFSGVSITREWLRRFAELTVACSQSSVMNHNHPRDSNNYFPVDRDQFDVAYIEWYHHGCPKFVRAHSCIDGGSMEPHVLQDIDPKRPSSYVSFLVAIGKWNKEQRLKGFIKPYELKEKADEIAQLMGLTAFSATKEWMTRFTMLRGLKYYHACNGIMVTKGRTIPDSEFMELFEAWYSEGTCSKCAQRYFEPHLIENIEVIEQPKKIAEATTKKRTKPIYIERQPTNAQSDQRQGDAQPSTPDVVDFESVIHIWYIEESISGTVAPGDLEKMAMEVAERSHITAFIPHKTRVEKYIGQCGLWCDIGGKRKLLFKSDFAFLKSKFSSEFEVWYHQWPLTVEETMFKHGDLGVFPYVSFDAYIQAVLSWYLEVSEIGKISLDDVKTKSDSIIKKKMPGITQQDVDVWTRRWCREHNYVTQKIRSFDFAMRLWYIENKKAGYISKEKLRMEAEKCANEKMGIPNFQATRNWLMRFVERNGVFLMTEGIPEFLGFTDVLRMDGFNEMVNLWYACSPQSKSVPIKYEPDSESSPGHSTGAEDVEMIVETVRTAQKHAISLFEAEVISWVKDVSMSVRRVTPGVYLDSVLQIRRESGFTVCNGLTWGFDHRKNSIKRLVELHGFLLCNTKSRLKFLNAECGILKWRFELAFEVWYYAYPLKVDDVSNIGDLNLFDYYLSSLRDWFIKLRTAGDVSAEEIRVKETEIANSMTNNSKGKRDLITRCCREWCSKTVAWIDKIRSLDSQVGSWYKAKKNAVKPRDLREIAATTARALDMEGFTATDAWLKRFVQLHGLHYIHEEASGYYPGFADRSLMVNWIEFGTHYNLWLKTDETNR